MGTRAHTIIGGQVTVLEKTKNEKRKILECGPYLANEKRQKEEERKAGPGECESHVGKSGGQKPELQLPPPSIQE